MREVRLNNGVMMPSVGFGVYQIDKSETKAAVLEALEVGYRMIDTAASYFNEREVGEAIRESGMPRESVFVTSKLWVQDYEYDDALRAFDRSLSELGLDYIDLYLLHKPYGNYYAAWRALERLHKEGRIRAIGVTSFTNERLQDLFLHNEIKPAVNQIETHPFQQQKNANAFLKAEGIDYVVNPRLVRGLDYYNLTVFEWVTDKLGAQGTICGGGRYDPLIGMLGGRDAPACGFAMGIERVLELMKECGVKPESRECDVYVVWDKALYLNALSAAERLRDADIAAIIHSGSMKFGNQMKRADASGALYALVIGADEAAAGKVGLKALRENLEGYGEQKTLTIDEAISFLGQHV